MTHHNAKVLLKVSDLQVGYGGIQAVKGVSFEVREGEVSAQGVTILLVEQNASRALQIADRGYVMESGVITLSGPAQDLLHDPKVRAAYLGA